MLSQKIQDAINTQINAEYYSSYLYLAMSAHAHSLNLRGFGHWFEIQAKEELGHVIKFFHYVLDRGSTVNLKGIDAPPTKWDSPLAAFEATLAHEQHVTRLIGNLVELARSEKDHATENMLQWFVNEQIEEEATADLLVHQLRLVGNAPAGLFMIDRELGSRQG